MRRVLTSKDVATGLLGDLVMHVLEHGIGYDRTTQAFVDWPKDNRAGYTTIETRLFAQQQQFQVVRRQIES